MNLEPIIEGYALKFAYVQCLENRYKSRVKCITPTASYHL